VHYSFFYMLIGYMSTQQVNEKRLYSKALDRGLFF